MTVDTSRQEQIIRTLEAEVFRLQRLNQLAEAARGEAEAEVGRLKAALIKIARPIAWLQKEADKNGARLDGVAAMAIANDAYYLRGIAEKALAAYDGEEKAKAPILGAV